jgi:transposase-like protein
MKKAIILFLVLAVVGLAFFSCYNDVTFCYYCGSRNIKEDGKEVGYGGEEIQMYKCNDCGKRFGVDYWF